MSEKNIRGIAAPVLLALLVVMVAAGVERYARPAGGLQLPPADVEGRHHYVLGGREYPREAVDSDGVRVRIPRPTHRIVSQYWSIDEFLYSIVPANEVVAVSSSAYEPTISNVLPLVQKYKPAVASDPERVLKLDPDLILVSSDGRADYTSLVRSAGATVFRMQVTFETLREVEDTIRLVGYVTGRDEDAARVATSFQKAIEAARERRPANAHVPRVLGLGGRYSYGRNTLFNDIIRALGGVNLGAEGGLEGYSSVSFEQIAQWNPEWIFAGANPGQNEQVRQQLLADPAIALTDAARKGQVLVIDNNTFLPMSPLTVRLVEAIADALYPQRQAGGAL